MFFLGDQSSIFDETRDGARGNKWRLEEGMFMLDSPMHRARGSRRLQKQDESSG